MESRSIFAPNVADPERRWRDGPGRFFGVVYGPVIMIVFVTTIDLYGTYFLGIGSPEEEQDNLESLESGSSLYHVKYALDSECVYVFRKACGWLIMKRVSELPGCRRRLIVSGLVLLFREGHFIAARIVGTLALSFRRHLIQLSTCVIDA